jgi:prolyl-tRNA synthetase
MINSYKDLPLAVYQIQEKFRDEPRAKSGLLRGREFSMKDMYSFHADEENLDYFYEKVKKSYQRVFERCGLKAILTEASGGTFSKFSHEFQVLTENGEDIIFYCEKCFYAQNKEISKYKEGDKCPKCGGQIKEGKAIEVGNIFNLKTRFSEAFDLSFLDKDGKKKLALMGCYGIGPSRVMGAIVEVNHDEEGIVWPAEVAPFDVHLIALFGKNDEKNKEVSSAAKKVCESLQKDGFEVLYDDREEVSAGVKFGESDLFGIPIRLVVSEKTLVKDSVEVKERNRGGMRLVKISQLAKNLG